MLKKIKSFIIGNKLDPLSKSSHKKIALTALLAWVGLGADGLSSSCYGPEQAFLALQHHTYLAIFLALAIGLTVFLIAFGYNQVIELFPSGGGGYRVSTALLGKYSGLVTGAALIMDYSLTIVISVVSAIDALFSLLPPVWQNHKLAFDTILILLLIVLNLRGMKESIKILLPIFIGFLLTHVFLIGYGIEAHAHQLPHIFATSTGDIHHLNQSVGLFFVAGLFLHAYAMGGGTYTGLEAVSNNVNVLAEPRVRTGKITMLYMAISLSLTAGGIILLYLLWNVVPNYHQTLNAIVFTSILNGIPFANQILFLTLLFEAGLLFVSANTGFLGGPAVLANMAVDEWVPHRFRNLSNRLVKQNGVILFGVASIILLFATDGHIGYLIVFYTINVFLAFTFSLIGLVKHWWTSRQRERRWLRKMLLAGTGAFVCGVILILVSVNRFFHGGLVSYLCLGLVVVLCLLTKQHYEQVNKKLKYVDKLLTRRLPERKDAVAPEYQADQPTAVFFVNNHAGVGMHTLLWALRMFPNYFKNLIFISVGEIDVASYGAEAKMRELEKKIQNTLHYFVEFAHLNGFAARTIVEFDTDRVEKIGEIAERLSQENSHCLYFASSFVWGKDSWFAQYLHNETAFAIQRKLHMQNKQMIIIPMSINDSITNEDHDEKPQVA